MTFWPCSIMVASLFISVVSLQAGDANLRNKCNCCANKNAMLQQQLQKQSQSLDALTQKVQGLEAANTQRENASLENPAPAGGGFSLNKVVLGGEGGIGFFKTGSQGFAPDSEFRVDEARIFIEAPIWKDVYFYGEVDLATPENNNTQVYLGELYVDFESVSQLWGRDQLNVRAGRMYIPFGEEISDAQTQLIIRSSCIQCRISGVWIPAWKFMARWENSAIAPPFKTVAATACRISPMTKPWPDASVSIRTNTGTLASVACARAT